LKVGVVGVGYLGLSTAVCLASKYPTIALEVNKERVSTSAPAMARFTRRGSGVFWLEAWRVSAYPSLSGMRRWDIGWEVV
jgi:hypothetical protein